jgi:rubrerythrin
MSFLEQAGKVAQKVGETTVKIAGEAKDATAVAIDKAKLKRQIRQEQASINKDLADIGKIYLRRHGDNPSEEYLPSIRSIKMSEKNIEVLNEKIVELNSVYTCQGCGAKLTRHQAFCKICGTRVEEENFVYDANFADNVDGAIAIIDQTDNV